MGLLGMLDGGRWPAPPAIIGMGKGDRVYFSTGIPIIGASPRLDAGDRLLVSLDVT